MAAVKTRRPPSAAIRAAADTLARALQFESERVREEQGHGGHSLAQELSFGASRVRGYAVQIEELRRKDRP